MGRRGIYPVESSGYGIRDATGRGSFNSSVRLRFGDMMSVNEEFLSTGYTHLAENAGQMMAYGTV